MVMGAAVTNDDKLAERLRFLQNGKILLASSENKKPCHLIYSMRKQTISYAKIKVTISCAVTAQLNSAFFLH